ncbi:acyltransferase family protein [Terracoccus sp. 273MFTsu3.1]|uniref:acyltransferase family protein n=1 Tax=Terracoccus sp. 273MFTsu3.1 TaxID=1172188 RepID=UPI0018CAC864|nr:acyltransferase family protein [Terracoccus sp. 273MFTsu3.1]
MSDGPVGGPRRADIQGLRAVTVTAVIAFHLFGWPSGGYLGVDAFFVVSGFVITGVLVRERDRTGRISLRDFWIRRARRILPLALLVIAAVVVIAPWAWAGAKVASIRSDALWAALFAANWHYAARADTYFDTGSAPSPLLHYWSLGVEEQFYVAWPLLVVLVVAVAGGGRRHRVAIGALAATVGAASLVWAAASTSSDPTTAYYSTLTRAWELALGAALATVPRAAVRLAPAARSALSWAGLATVLTAYVLVTPDTGVPWPAALGVALGTVLVLVAGIGAPAPGAVLLTNPVSGYVGDVSYGLYLWHFPLVVLAPVVLTSTGATSAAVVLAGTLVLAVVSHHLVERPVLDAPRVRRRSMLAAALALALLVVGVGGTATARPDLFAGGTVVAADDPDGAVPPPEGEVPAPTAPNPEATPTLPTSPTTRTRSAVPGTSWRPIPLGASGTRIQEGLRGALASGSWPADLNPSPDQWQTTADQRAAMSACTATDAEDPESCTFGNRAGPEIIVYGDSIGFPLLATVEEAFGRTYTVRGMTKIACAVNGVDANYGKDEWALPCVDHRKMVLDYVRRVKPKVLIMTETYSWAVRLKSHAKGAASAKEWLAADQAFVDAVRGSVGTVVIVAPSMPGVAFLDCYRPGGSPGRCVTGIPTWWARTRDVEKKVQHAVFVDTTHWYCVDGRCPIFTTTTGTVLKGDYLHTSLQYARQLAPDLAYLLEASGVRL